MRHNHLPGDSTESMPLDENLPKNWTYALKENVLLTVVLDDNNPMSFSRSIPENLPSSMRRLWDGGSPSSVHIVHAIRKVVCTNMPIIKEHKGELEINLGNKRGNR